MRQGNPIKSKQNPRLCCRAMAVSVFFLWAALPALSYADWPVAVQDTTSALSNQQIEIQVLANDIGEGLLLNEVNTTTVALGSASISADKQSITYQPAKDFVGQDSFWYNFKDSQGRVNASQVFVDVAHRKPAKWPSASPDSVDVIMNTAIKIPVLKNDDGVGLKITQVNDWTVNAGTAKIVDNGQSVEYTPASDFEGPDEFWYVFSDQWGRTNAGKVSPLVKPDYSGWPSAEADYTVTSSIATVMVDVLDNDVGEDLTLIAVNDWTVNGGRAYIEGINIRYTPPSDFIGEDSFWYDFEDAQGRKNSAQVFVNVTNSASLSSIEFCGVTYQTDGTVENTHIIPGAADPEAMVLTTSVETEGFPEQTEGNFAVLDDRRYFLVETSDAKEIWMEKGGDTTQVSTHTGSVDVYGLGIRDNVLYYVNVTDDSSQNLNPSAPSHLEQLYAHDGNTVATLGVYNIYDRSNHIKILKNKDAVYFTLTAEEGDTYGAHYMIESLSSEPVLVAKNVRVIYGGGSLSSIFTYDGFIYSSTNFSYRDSGRTTMSITNTSDPEVGSTSNIDGMIDSAVVSNDRLLIRTREHSDPSNQFSLGTVYPPKLYATNSDHEYKELAVCED